MSVYVLMLNAFSLGVYSDEAVALRAASHHHASNYAGSSLYYKIVPHVIDSPPSSFQEGKLVKY